jgi:hypothetical protein
MIVYNNATAGQACQACQDYTLSPVSLNEDLSLIQNSVSITLNDLKYVLVDNFAVVLTEETLKLEIIES